MKEKIISRLALACSAFVFTSHATAEVEHYLAAWVQYTDGGQEVRIVTREDCPAISIDGKSVATVVRAAPTDAHPNTVCAASLPKKVKSIKLAGEDLPLPVSKRPRRVVVVGDTGCRLSDKHGLYQECNNDSLWPFAQVARAVGEYDPDLIIYTGDYIYRESACPDGDKGCEGSPYGDIEATWEVDWFGPAKPIHRTAPMILIRGNHETCSRAGTGWFRYLDARPVPEQGCLNTSDPWVVSFNRLQVAVMDVANLKTVEPPKGKSLAPLFAEQLTALDKELNQPAWLTAHRTFWGYGADDDTGELTTPTAQLQEAVRLAGLPDKTRLLIGAHIHLAEVLDFGNKRPPQLVVANGGTQLVSRVDPPEAIDGVTIQSQQVFYQYGFVAMEATGDESWSISFRDIEGRELEHCDFDGSQVKCEE